MQTTATPEKSKSTATVAMHKNKQQSFFAPLKVQPKLTIGAVDDHYEQEADAMADKVMRMPESTGKNEQFFKPPFSFVQRKCSKCNEEDKLHMKSDGVADAGTEAPSIVHDVINSGGQPLDTKTKSFFGPRFGKDFSKVRIHDNAIAAKSADSINALAYTTGNNVVFNEGQYSPDTDSGKRLLGHELTHVVQQDNHSQNNIQPKEIQRAPTISTVDENFVGPLMPSQHRASLSCPIRCNATTVGTLHSMGLFYHQSRTGIRTAPTASDNGVGTELHFIGSGPQRSCTCDDFKIIQIITTTHPAAGRDGKGYVDNNNTNTPFYGDVYLSGSGEHEIPAGYPDAGDRVTTTHSIYDRPARPTAGLNSEIRWQAEANVACVRNAAPDIVLGGVSYGFRIPYNSTTHSFGTIEGIGPYCLSTATSNFERTLRSDPTTSTYDFQVDYGPGDFEVSEAVRHMA